MRRVARLFGVLAGAVACCALSEAAAAADVGSQQTALPALTPFSAEAPGDASASSVAVNASGQAVVGWVQQVAGPPPKSAAFVALRGADGTWSAFERVSSVSEDAVDVKVAIGADGTATIAWTERADYYAEKVAVVRHTAAGFVDRQTFVPPTGGADRLVLSTNASGDAVLAWSAYVPCNEFACGYRGSADVFAASRSGQGSFGAPQQLSETAPPKADRRSLAASIGARGDIAVAWEEGETTAMRVRVRRQPAGGAFTPAVEFNAGHVASAVPAVVVGPSGGTTVTWWERRAMRASRIAADGAVAPTQTLPGVYNDGFAQGPAVLGADDAGRLTAAWITNDGIWTATAEPGADFGSGVALDQYATASGVAPALSVEPGGGTLVGWMNTQALRGAWRPVGESSFRSAATITGGAFGERPRVALAGRTALIAAQFGDRSHGAGTLFATVGDAAAIAPTPSLLPVTVPDTTAPRLKLTRASVVKSKSSKNSGKKRAAARELRVAVDASEAAQVVVTVTKRLPGERRGKDCVKPPSGKSKKKTTKACSRVVTVGSPLKSAVPAGSTKLVGKAPAKGTYELVLTGADTAGNAAAASTRRLVVR